MEFTTQVWTLQKEETVTLTEEEAKKAGRGKAEGIGGSQYGGS